MALCVWVAGACGCAMFHPAGAAPTSSGLLSTEGVISALHLHPGWFHDANLQLIQPTKQVVTLIISDTALVWYGNRRVTRDQLAVGDNVKVHYVDRHGRPVVLSVDILQAPPGHTPPVNPQPPATTADSDGSKHKSAGKRKLRNH